MCNIMGACMHHRQAVGRMRRSRQQRPCGWDNGGKEENIGKYGVGESNEAGDNNCVAFAMSNNMRVVNTYFDETGRHKITYKSGAAVSQNDYILCIQRKGLHQIRQSYPG